ncbi:ATP-binding protein [Mycetocola reblochoni]|uniref:Putative two-component system sensor kinase n=1 Tax=Mycetocola reblochoni REB411 TaxID=1255698 RepID=A0A1R4K816_9MICO|nr:ATP-binding protein [Mycetocola reblochoni]SJN40439.1 putative two-component system sensor kinase [Mycetocola reblochoni REB411]
MSTPPAPGAARTSAPAGTGRAPLLRRPSGRTPGVASGLAAHLGRPVRQVRLALALLSLVGGFGALLYLWLWLALPVQTADGRRPPAATVLPTAAIGLGATAACVVLALGDTATRQATALPAAPIAPGLVPALACAAATMCWSLMVDRGDPARGERYSRLVRLGTAGLLVAGSLGLLFGSPAAPTAILAVLMLATGAVLFVLPTLVILWTELIDERAARARDGERAEIAAHLHDSVLQSLALIQRRAGPGTDVARIARAQERELRDWLFGADSAPARDLATAIAEDAARIELEHPVRIDVVSSGDADGLDEATAAAVIAATREALLNAARHAGGDVSVYVERGRGRVDVFVKDRGPGIDPGDIPADRIGVRESIIGRIRRVGGTATVRRGRGEAPQGTEVSITVEEQHD